MQQTRIRKEAIEPLKTYSRVEAASVLGCSLPTVDRLVRERQIEFCKIGRRTIFLGQSLVDFLTRQRVAA